jgi:tetrahydromethanopterin S-methyltransferase subunit G
VFIIISNKFLEFLKEQKELLGSKHPYPIYKKIISILSKDLKQSQKTEKNELNKKKDFEKRINELKEYVDKTYGEHYSLNKFQATEFIIDSGHGIGFTVGNVMKYAQRYGKKAGRNRQDILKVLHYALMLLYTHDIETKEIK